MVLVLQERNCVNAHICVLHVCSWSLLSHLSSPLLLSVVASASQLLACHFLQFLFLLWKCASFCSSLHFWPVCMSPHFLKSVLQHWKSVNFVHVSHGIFFRNMVHLWILLFQCGNGSDCCSVSYCDGWTSCPRKDIYGQKTDTLSQLDWNWHQRYLLNTMPVTVYD